MKNKPNKVFLQINLDGEDVEDFKDLSEVCSERTSVIQRNSRKRGNQQSQFQKIILRIMEINEIKKALYKEKPIAEKVMNQDDNVVYVCETSIGNVKFVIPNIEAVNFEKKEPAQLLIRWIVT